jgi:glycosyltransferase involved in cell wall biosynthesis
MVRDDCGILVPVTSHEDMVAGYRDAILRLSADPDYLEQLSRGARGRAGHYSWARQGERMRDIYNKVLSSPGGGAVE